MQKTDREQQSQRLFYALIVALLLAYAAIKSHHIQLAVEVYRGQILDVDMTGAAN